MEKATAFLLHSAAEAKVRHLSYWYLQYRDGAPDQVIWSATYDPAYMNYYMSVFTPLDDPVINDVMDNKFVDWAEWFEVDHLAQKVDLIAERFGLTRYGISMPLPAPGEDKIIFSVCVDSNDEGWPQQRNALVLRFLPFAKEFDRRMRKLVEADQQGASVFKLSA
ncbi:MAG: autoinducer binding domain-containing protein [Aestuariivirga sp.]